MVQKKLRPWLCAALLALASVGADAAGLGRLNILSYLGQPLNAEIDLVSISKSETITARIAPPESYAQAGLTYDPALAGARIAVQSRPNGTPYLKVTSFRPMSEPFLQLLVDLNTQHGRVTRQYTALLDPPGYGSAAAELPPPITPPVASVPQARPVPAPEAPSAAALAPTAPQPSPPLVPPPSTSAAATAEARPSTRRGRARPGAPAAAATTGEGQYGPIKRGETLGRIARIIKPEGVTLEQTLVGLYRENPDAFIRKNMNLVKSGKILRVPDASALTSVGQSEAVKEVRLQTADFNAYRGRLAERAGNASEEGSVRSGRIGRVADRATTEAPRDTVRVSRGEPGSAKGKGSRTAAERVRTLEEEAIAREKALNEANDRIEKLEKTIKETQKLAELKSAGMAGAQQAAEKATAPAAKKEEPAKKAQPTAVATAPQAAPAKAGEAPKPTEPAAKGVPVSQAPATPPQSETKGAPAPAAEAKKAEPAKAEPPKTAAAPKKAAPPPPPQTDFLDLVTSDPLYMAGGAAVLIALGAGGLWAVRRRRGQTDDGLVKIAPTLGRTSEPSAPKLPPSSGAAGASAATLGGAAAGAAAAASARASTKPTAPEPVTRSEPALAPQPEPAPERTGADDNDLDFGAMPTAAKAAGETRSAAPRVEPQPAASQRATTPSRPAEVTPPPRSVEPPPPPRVEPPPPPRVQPPVPPRVEAPPPPPVERAPAPTPEPEAPSAPMFETVTPASREPQPIEPMIPDFALDTPATGESAPARDDSNVIDFTLDPLPPVGTPEPEAQAQSAQSEKPGLDFDLKGLDLDFGKKQSSQQAAPARDEHWYDVQQKFDLAKAYEEMGDKDGARDILKEVVKEGDSDQQAQAKQLLETLS